MPITKPDEFKHGNVNLAFVDSDFVRGGIRVVTSASNLTDATMQSKVDQLKDNATLVYVTNDSVFYRLKSKADITNLANGWEEIDLTGTDGLDGNTVLSGAGAPGAGVGDDGDFYIDTSNNKIYGPKASSAWPAAVSLVGASGLPGAAATIAAGTATSVSSNSSPSVTNSGSASAATFDFEIPSGAAGIDGDGFTGGSYDSSTGVVTFTSDDTLGFATLDLRGSNGLAGDDGKTVLNGSGVPSSGLGSDGDFYIDTTNENIYGPKTGGNTWGSATSLIGSTGPTGPGYSGGSYNSTTGVVTLTGSGGSSNVTTGDLRGEDGDDATITAGTTTTGAEGTNASVSNSGTSSAAVFNFTIPRGATGQQGPTGPTGPQGPTIFNSFANTSARDSVAAADRVEGFLAYLKDDDDLYIYTSSSVTDSDWEAATGAANWKLIPKDYTVETDIDTANIINATAGEYFFNLIDTTGSVNEFKKFDVNDFFGWMASQFAQTLVDSGSATSGELTFGSGNVLGDLTGDNAVGTNDLLLLLSYYGGTVSGDNLSGESTVELDTTAYVNNLAGVTTFVTLPIATSDISFTNNGFATNFIDADDKFGYEDGTGLTLSSYFAQDVAELFMGYSGDRIASGAINEPIVLEGSFSTNDFVTLKVFVDIEYSESAATTTTDNFVIENRIIEEPGSQELELIPKNIFSLVKPAINSDYTVDKIRLQLKYKSLNGNTTSIRVKSGAFYLKN